MSDVLTIARPYAKAIFDMAKVTRLYNDWEKSLKLLAMITKDANMVRVIKDPMIITAEKAEFVIEVGGEHFNAASKTLIRLLALNDRLLLAPEIHTLYVKYRHEEEQMLEVSVCSAIALNSAQKTQLQTAIGSYFNKTVILHWQEDPTLLGGIVVRAGDKVFDGSIRGRLQTLHTLLTTHQ